MVTLKKFIPGICATDGLGKGIVQASPYFKPEVGMVVPVEWPGSEFETYFGTLAIPSCTTEPKLTELRLL